MTKILSKSEILQVVDIKTELVEVPEWGGSVMIREFTGTDRDAYEAGSLKLDASGNRQVDLQNMRAKLVAACVVDHETGDLMWSEADVERLGRKNAAALDRIADAIKRLNKMGVNAVEDAAKNSEAAPSGSSTSVSPAT